MSNRRFEMYQYRQVICRMRLGETDRRIAKAGLMGRRKAAELRQIAQEQGWTMAKVKSCVFRARKALVSALDEYRQG